MVTLICADYFMFTFITTIPAITSVTTALQTKYGASYAQVGEYGVAVSTSNSQAIYSGAKRNVWKDACPVVGHISFVLDAFG
jgi:hypothetical protein